MIFVYTIDVIETHILLEQNKGRTIILVRDYWGRQSDSIIGQLWYSTYGHLWHVDGVGVSSVFSDNDIQSVGVETINRTAEEIRNNIPERPPRLVIRLNGPPVPRLTLIGKFIKWICE